MKWLKRLGNTIAFLALLTFGLIVLIFFCYGNSQETGRINPPPFSFEHE